MAVKMARVAALPETSILDKKKKEKVASQWPATVVFINSQKVLLLAP